MMKKNTILFFAASIIALTCNACFEDAGRPDPKTCENQKTAHCDGHDIVYTFDNPDCGDDQHVSCDDKYCLIENNEITCVEK